MQKINKLKLKNFKFFYGDSTINFERKNVLIYGENGSGKSSIYWALYTFLQSVLKTDVRQIKKYFDHKSDQNLINRFAPDDCDCGIIVEFVDDHKSITTKEISNTTINTNRDVIVKDAVQASDFITYKLLAKLYDFKNSQNIDLFSLFEDEILMFINFRETLVRHDAAKATANAADWWKYLAAGLDPRPRMNEPNYKTFQAAVHKFNDELDFYLNKITESTNEYLKKFKQNVKLKFRYEKAEYARFANDGTKKRIHETSAPKIILDIAFDHEKLAEHKKAIVRPQSFLNEARLTTIALAVRFAIFDEKLQTDDLPADAPKLLILDDLLLSLDMSNRDVVLELIINEFRNVQILIMTHDKAFFNLAKRRIEFDNHAHEWIYKELYQGSTDAGIPEPCIPSSKDHLAQAKKYLKEFDYPACANYLRKEAERLLKHLLPFGKTVFVKEGEATKPLPLDGLIDNFKNYYKTFCSEDAEFNHDYAKFKKLKEHKDILLNPLSHDNIDTPIYKLELEAVMELLAEMRKLDHKTVVSIKDDTQVFIFLTEVDAAGDFWTYTIHLKEHLRAFKKFNDEWVLSNPQCEVIKRTRISDNKVENITNKNQLRRIHNQVKHQLGIKDVQPQMQLSEVVYTNDNKRLADLLKS